MNTTLNQLKFARIYTLGKLANTEGPKWDLQPEGVNNTVRWNAGHIFVSMENFVQQIDPTYEPVHPEWFPFFMSGTSPMTWDEAAPSEEDILEELKIQPERVIYTLQDKMEQLLPKAMEIGEIHSMTDAESLLHFAIWHEGIHAGVIHVLNNVNCN